MRTAEVAREAAEAGITPIEVMLGTMRELWDQGTIEARKEAAAIARHAAPYIHPRLASIDQTIHEPAPRYVALMPERMSEEEWMAKYGQGNQQEPDGLGAE